VKRCGPYLYETKAVRNKSTDQVVDWVLEEISKSRLKPDHLCVDVSGGIGAGHADMLRRHLGHLVVDVNVSWEARLKENYFQLRDELWWNLRSLFESRLIKIVPDEVLIRQLSTIRYDQMPTGRVKVEAKKEMRKRGIGSPDRADALCISLYNDPLIEPQAPDKAHRPKA
jgi:hypothetical protein